MKVSPETSTLSRRGQANNDNLETIIDQFTNILHNTYHPETNPKGIINAGIAENSLHHEALQSYYSTLPVTFGDFTYGDNLGSSQELSHLYASFLNRTLAPTLPIKSTDVSVLHGVSAVIDAIIYSVCDPGDGVLITAPYYNGFDTDVSLRSSARAIAVSCPDTAEPHLLRAALEKEFLHQRSGGVHCRAVILCNPHNPLGKCPSRAVLLAYLDFCRAWDVWLISDEIYAYSVFDSPDALCPEGFTSILTLTEPERAGFERIVMLEGMSKDFCANGFRVGCCVTQHSKALRVSMNVNAILGNISSLSDAAFRKMLGDEKYLDAFLARNKCALREAYLFFTGWCRDHGIEYAPSHAGHFLVLDLRRFLRHATFEGEATLAKIMLEHGVFVSAGAQYHFPEPGFFRFTFTMRRDYLDIALERFAQALSV